MDKTNNNSNYGSNKDDVDFFRGQERKKTLSKKFGIKKDYIEESDLESLVEKMKLTICKEDVQNLFNYLDLDKTGKVSLETFVDKILSSQESKNENDFFKSINDQLTTKAERIIIKLKQLRDKVVYANDKESMDDFDW
jgi:Ca2+-binding EF-hand superfamily protein